MRPHLLVSVAAFTAACLAACGDDRSHGGDDDDDACVEAADCPEVSCSCGPANMSGRGCEDGVCISEAAYCAQLGCDPGAGEGGSSSGAGGSPSGAAGGAAATTSTGEGAAPRDRHVPQCVAYVNNYCTICEFTDCSAGTQWWEDTVSTCDSFYDVCTEYVNCMAAAPTCDDLFACPEC